MSIRLDKVQATHDGGLINFKAAADIRNGTVFYAEDLAAGERELFTATQPATADLTVKSLYVHASVETIYEVGKTINDFILKAGQSGRGILMKKGDIITIADSVITGATTVGQYVQPVNASYQLSANATLPTSVFKGKVIAKENIYGVAATVIEVLAN